MKTRIKNKYEKKKINKIKKEMNKNLKMNLHQTYTLK